MEVSLAVSLLSGEVGIATPKIVLCCRVVAVVFLDDTIDAQIAAKVVGLLPIRVSCKMETPEIVVIIVSAIDACRNLGFAQENPLVNFETYIVKV